MNDNLPEVRIGTVRVEKSSLSTLPDLAVLLQAEERHKLSLLHRVDDQFNFAVGRVLARAMLDQVAKRRERDWVFEQNSAGKPVLHSQHAADIDFSIAHAAGMVAVAVCKGHAVGIDVENTGTPVHISGIASLCFTPAETERLNAESEHKRADLFFSLWVMKEACSKAQQTGLVAPLCDMSAHLGALVDADRSAVLQVHQWTVLRRRPSTEHLLAVAVRNEGSDRIACVETSFRVRDLLR